MISDIEKAKSISSVELMDKLRQIKESQMMLNNNITAQNQEIRSMDSELTMISPAPRLIIGNMVLQPAQAVYWVPL